MRIVISSGSRTWGGLESVAESLARGLARKGHQVVLFCRRESPLHRRLRADFPCEPILGGDRLNPLTLARCLRALQRHRPDAVIGNTIKDPGWSGVAARLLGIPVVYRHEFNTPYPGRTLDRFLFGRVPARHVVNSEAARQTLLTAQWLDPERVVVVPNGVDIDGIDAAVPAELGIPSGATVFGFVGRWEEQKGARELTAAWRQVVAAAPSAHLAVAGLGPSEAEFRESIGSVPHVHWLGFRSDIASVMKALDVLVLPSHNEGFGLVVAEAMASGVSVVATRTGAIPELVADGVQGRLVPVRDAGALAGAMIELAVDPELRRKMARAGRERARRHFTLDRMIERHEALLREVAGAGAAR